jgi:tetratricopeptide (TPR) repeat protein
MTEPEQPDTNAVPPETEPRTDPSADMDPAPPADGSAVPDEAAATEGPVGNGAAANGAGLFDDGLPPEFTAGLRSHRGMWYLIVAANALVLAGLAAVFLLWKPWDRPAPRYAGPPPGRYPSREQPPNVTPAEPPVQDAFSLRLEEEAYAAGRYRDAVDQCDRLLLATRGNPRDELLGDFFRLRRAQSQKWLGEMEDARDGLLTVTESPSPLVRGLALLELAQLSLADRQYLTARTEAYRALGAFGAVIGTAALEDTCDFLTAEALTRKALAFHGADDLLPEADLAPPDPFASLPGERAIRSALEAGVQRFQDAATGLRADRKEPDGGGIPLWSITSVGAPLEEILHRISASAEVAVMWAGTKPPARRRAVLMAVRDVSTPRAIEVACGSTGLVARLSGAEVEIHDPRDFRSTPALQSLLAKEAESMWRRRLLDSRAAARHAWAHYALGLLHEHGGETASAMAEFNLLTRQHASSPLAPRAQLRSAGIRIGLRDYAGAREQLLDLLNRHPNFPESDLVYLRLGQAALKTGLYEKATATFRKLYYWELSRPSQIGAAFGAGKGYSLLGQHHETVEWLGRYRQIARGTEHANRAEAEYLLATSLLALGEVERAEAALRRCLSLEPPHPLRADATLALADVVAKAEEFAEALALLHRVAGQGTPADRIDQAVLAEARLLQDMGLARRAMHRLKERRPKAAGTQAAVDMEIEIARCAVALDDPEDARRLLAGAAAHLDPGPLARRVSVELAEVHLVLGRVREAARLARTVLAEETRPAVRRHALQILGKAYLARSDYDRAAIAFAGKVPDLKEGDHP